MSEDVRCHVTGVTGNVSHPADAGNLTWVLWKNNSVQNFWATSPTPACCFWVYSVFPLPDVAPSWSVQVILWQRVYVLPPFGFLSYNWQMEVLIVLNSSCVITQSKAAQRVVTQSTQPLPYEVSFARFLLLVSVRCTGSAVSFGIFCVLE